MAERSRPFRVSDREYPFASHWLERGGVAMHYVDEGEGQPVLMLHGNPTWSFLYRKIIKPIREECRAVAPDYPGFGFSEHPPGYRYTPEEHSWWVRELIDALELDRMILVMQDWGGPIGLSIATEIPERISGLVLCNTWCWTPDLYASLFSRAMGGDTLGRLLQLQLNFFARRIVPAGIRRRAQLGREVLDAYTAPFSTPRSRVGTWAFPKAIRGSAGWLSYVEGRLSRLADKPVELVWGMRDPAFGRESILERWRSHFPHATIERLRDASHYLQEDRPERISAAVRRVQRLASDRVAQGS